jgi:hypothetical protein
MPLQSLVSSRPRAERDLNRGRLAAARAREAGASAMEAAMAQIDATFGEAAIVNSLKMRVERFIGMGTGHPAVHARFGARAAMLRHYNIDQAILVVERWYADERRAVAIASAFGGGSTLSLNVLAEIRLILRLIRRDAALRGHLSAICAFVIGSDRLEAAE